MLFRLAPILLIGGTLISVAVLDTVDHAAASCGDAKQHADAGRLKLAEDDYSAILKADSETRCAIRGLHEVHCDQADAVEEALPAEAQKRYLAVLKEHPHSACATKGLAAMAAQRCDQARELLDQEPALQEEALKAYTALLDVEPRPRCVVTGLNDAHAVEGDGEADPQTGEPEPPPAVCCCCGDCEQPPDDQGGRCDR